MRANYWILGILVFFTLAFFGCGGDGDSSAPAPPAAVGSAPGGGDGGDSGSDGGGGGAPQQVAKGSMLLPNGAGSSTDFQIPGPGHLTASVSWSVATGQVTIYFIIDGQERGMAQSGAGDVEVGAIAGVSQAGTGHLVIINGGQLPPSPQQFDYSVNFFPK